MTEPTADREQPQGPATPLRVLIADDHPVVRSGIRNELTRHADIEIIGEAVDGDEALRLAQTLQPDVLLLDINMPGLKAVEVMRQLKRLPAAPRILVLTAYGDEENVLGMLKAGATGYLLKDEDPAAIVDGVRAVAQGRPWLSAAVSQVLVRHTVGEEEPSPEGKLSERERAVLRLLARGYSNAQIAAGLGIAERTVRHHLHNLYDKLGVKGRGEAIAWAVRKRLGEE